MDDTSGSRYQSFYPRGSGYFLRSITKVTSRGLNEADVANFKRIYGDTCFKQPCQCPKCPKKV